ncbi:MAG: FeoA family protein [Dehalococcoides mccartyi]|uniref:FeoA family protein n=1 Tax=Dehalococcoides mccartyi TaxID=61435 RepID=UPI0025C7A3D2|nr:FeoA family protein [Dehalococcoides mccartyi]MDN4186413.1 FeoA family protein [Dehalococcoides mccartyi]
MAQQIVSLANLKNGSRARVCSIEGGTAVNNRLSALGLRPGKELTKISAMSFKGPVTVKVDGTQLAMGHGMASKVMVEVAGI